MNTDIKEKIKTAICCNNISFLEQNKDKYSIDERFEDEDNDSLLLYSISDSDSFMYTFFLENGANINLVNSEGEGVLHAIVYSGDVSRLIYVLRNYTVNLNLKMNDGASPLLLAISLKKYDIAKTLIKAGADVNITDNNKISPLHIAAQDGNLKIVSMLVDNGAIIKIKTYNGNYPIALAINKDHDEIVKYLYDKIYI